MFSWKILAQGMTSNVYSNKQFVFQRAFNKMNNFISECARRTYSQLKINGKKTIYDRI